MSDTFHVVSLHRSGSALLCSALNSHPDIYCPHEPTTEIQHALDAYTSQIRIMHESTDKRVVGYHHHAQLTTAAMLDDANINIHLHRRDIRQGAIAEMSLGFPRANGKFTLKESFIDKVEATRRSLDAELAAVADVSICFEDLHDGGPIAELPENISRQLCEAIGVDYQPLITSTKPEAEKRPKGNAKQEKPNEESFAVFDETMPAHTTLESKIIKINDSVNTYSIAISRENFGSLPTDEVLTIQTLISIDKGKTWNQLAFCGWGGGNHINRRGYLTCFAYAKGNVKQARNRQLKLIAKTYDHDVPVNADLDVMVF